MTQKHRESVRENIDHYSTCKTHTTQLNRNTAKQKCRQTKTQPNRNTDNRTTENANIYIQHERCNKKTNMETRENANLHSTQKTKQTQEYSQQNQRETRENTNLYSSWNGTADTVPQLSEAVCLLLWSTVWTKMTYYSHYSYYTSVSYTHLTLPTMAVV